MKAAKRKPAYLLQRCVCDGFHQKQCSSARNSEILHSLQEEGWALVCRRQSVLHPLGNGTQRTPIRYFRKIWPSRRLRCLCGDESSQQIPVPRFARPSQLLCSVAVSKHLQMIVAPLCIAKSCGNLLNWNTLHPMGEVVSAKTNCTVILLS